MEKIIFTIMNDQSNLRVGVLCLMLCSILVNGYSQEKKKTYWKNGKLKAHGAYHTTGYKIGKWVYYYQNGQKEAEGLYNGKKTDYTIEVFKLSKNSAINDKIKVSSRDGLWVFYYANGQKKGKITYENGCPVNKVIRWHKNGKTAEESEYIDCKLAGGRMMWDKEGRKYFETRNEGNNKTMDIEWYANGQMKSMIPYKNGEQYGRVKRWYANGQREEDVMMKNTRVHGSYRSWYANGKKQREFFSINNVMSGEYREWNESGQLVREIIEVKDKEMIKANKMIEVKVYWDNGQLKMHGTSQLPPSLSIHQWARSRHSAWTYWDREGDVMKTENYSNGQLTSVEMP